jgi:hypothetical protein
MMIENFQSMGIEYLGPIAWSQEYNGRLGLELTTIFCAGRKCIDLARCLGD